MMRVRPLPALLLAVVLAAAAAGCSEDDPVKAKDDETISWPDMTSRDDVIETILLCYENPRAAESMTRYEALLHSQYFFALDEQDVDPGDPPIMTRAEDIASTQYIFENNTILELFLVPEEGGLWMEHPEIAGEACPGCWAGERDYMIRFQYGDEDVIYLSSPGSASVFIVVAPDEGDPSKWVLRAMYDIYGN